MSDLECSIIQVFKKMCDFLTDFQLFIAVDCIFLLSGLSFLTKEIYICARLE
jgi:hypothetical protein